MIKSICVAAYFLSYRKRQWSFLILTRCTYIISTSYQVEPFLMNATGQRNVLTENHIPRINELQKSLIYTWEPTIPSQVSTTDLLSRTWELQVGRELSPHPRPRRFALWTVETYFHPQKPRDKSGMVVRSPAMPVLERRRQGNAWGSVASQPSTSVDCLASERAPVSKQNGERGSVYASCIHPMMW